MNKLFPHTHTHAHANPESLTHQGSISISSSRSLTTCGPFFEYFEVTANGDKQTKGQISDRKTKKNGSKRTRFELFKETTVQQIVSDSFTKNSFSPLKRNT